MMSFNVIFKLIIMTHELASGNYCTETPNVMTFLSLSFSYQETSAETAPCRTTIWPAL